MLISDIFLCSYHEKYFYSLTDLIHNTIKKCYPQCYSEEVVDFFLGYHSKKELRQKTSKGFFVLAIFNKNVVGCGYLLNDEIGGLYVHPEHQSVGIGSLILDQLIKMAKENKLKAIWLDATPISKNIYLNRGFNLIEKKVMYVGNNAPLEYFYMVKDL